MSNHVDVSVAAQASLQLGEMFPEADPGFLASCVVHHLDSSPSRSAGKGKGRARPLVTPELVQLVSTKLLASHGEYPRASWKRTDSGKPALDLTLMRNKALIRLHAMFPTVPIRDIRQLLLELEHSFITAGTAKLIQLQRNKKSTPQPALSWFARLWSKSVEETPRSSAPQTLEAQDLFRSAEHEAALVAELHSLYPQAPLWMLRQRVAEGGTFEAMCQDAQAQLVRQPKVKAWFSDLFSFGSTSPAPTEEAARVACDEAASEVATMLQRSREELVKRDATLAQQLNAEWAEDDGLLFECGCCFADVPFEQLATCSTGAHLFCRECLRRQVQQHAFAGVPLALDLSGPGSGSGVRCLSIEGCLASFTEAELERCLPPDLLHELSRRQAEAQLERFDTRRGKGKVVRCPFCPYAEIERELVLLRMFPLLVEPDITSEQIVNYTLRTLLALPVLVVAFLLLVIVISLAPDSFTAFTNDATRLFPLVELRRTCSLATLTMKRVAQDVIFHKNGRRNAFKCKNDGRPLAQPRSGPRAENAETARTRDELIRLVWPSAAETTGRARRETCGKLSCRMCEKEYVDGLHRCFENERDSLRLAIERARTAAVKRVCHRCGLAFMKETDTASCNKMTCRCGAVSCWNCRSDIQLEGYAHFCQHVLPTIVDGRCDECAKCSLWKTPSEGSQADVAGAKAKEQWLREHRLSESVRGHVLADQSDDLVRLYTTSAVAAVFSLLL